LKKLITILVVFLLMAGCVFGFLYYEKKTEDNSNQEYISMGELFDVSGNDIALIFNYSLQPEKGEYRNDTAYLPLSWVHDNINDKFFWEDSEKMMLYTLPDEIIYYRLSDEKTKTAPLFYEKGEEIYVSVDFVKAHSDIQISQFCRDTTKRIYIEDTFDPYEVVVTLKDTMLRTGESEIQRCIALIPKERELRVIKRMESGWLRIVTEDGLPGYVDGENVEFADSITPQSTFNAPEYSHLLMNEEVILAWHQTTNQTANDSLADALAHTRGINVISPTWFSVTDNDGNISDNTSTDYVNYAHDQGIKVWALVDNFSPEINSTKLLSVMSARQNLIGNLVDATLACGADGINVDFEQLEEACGKYFVEFIRELSIVCREKGLVLSVDNPNMQAFNAFYGRDAQAECADYVINMGYDEHYAGGEPGSVASIPFVEEGIDLTLSQVPARQLINGIPFYTRLWDVEKGESQALDMATAKKWVEDNQVQLQWQEDIGQYYGSKDNFHLWQEEAESLDLKIKLTRSKHLAGIACWKLTLETSDVWDLF